MNLIINEIWSNLTIENASNFMLIWCFGMPIEEFETNDNTLLGPVLVFGIRIKDQD